MARIGFCQKGFQGLFTRSDCFLPHLSGTGDSNGAFTLPLQPDGAFNLYWNYHTLRWNYNITLTPVVGVPVIYSGNKTAGITGVASEKDLVCSSPIFDAPALTDFIDTTIEVVSYDHTSDLFTINPILKIGALSGIGSETSFYPNLGSASVACTVLGNAVQLYFDTTQNSSATGTLTVDVDTYWEYDNGSGAVFDASSGAQLISPAPQGL